ncbi:MAG: hypothetical protein ABIF01_01985, partial [Candidatus Micrarchaeota archaeon]
MKKGFVFTVVFSLFFLMLIYSAAFYLKMLEGRGAALDSREAAREGYFADDVGYDYLSIWGMKTSLARDSKVHWTIEDRIPPAGDIGNVVSAYQEFVLNEYSRANNIDAKAELGTTGELMLEPLGIVYGHSGRSDIIIEGVIPEYVVKAKLAKACSGGCSGAGE